MRKLSTKELVGVVVGGFVIMGLIVFTGGGEENGGPQEVFTSGDKGVAKVLAETEGLHARAVLALNLPDTLRGNLRPFNKVTFELDGDLGRDGNGLQFAGDMKAEARGKGNALFANGEMRLFPDTTTFYLDEFPVLLNSSGSLSEKWTYVDTKLLSVNQEEAVKGMEVLLSALNEETAEEIDGKKLVKFSGELSEENEVAIAEAWAEGRSGSPSLDVLARLVESFDAKEVAFWVDEKKGELRQVHASFTQLLSEGGERTVAEININLSDYGKEVDVERPTKELTVRPEVFGKLFGGGQVEEVK